MVEKEPTVPPSEMERPGRPLGPAAGDLLLGDSQGEPPPGHVQLDLVPVPNQAERPADPRLRRDV